MTSTPGTILVVDDDFMNRMLLATNLEEQGHSVKMAENGQKALEMLYNISLDMVLLDLSMPKMDGFQVLEKIKAEITLQHIPVLIISGEDDMENIVRCIEMGAEDFLPKPFNSVLLRARIRACLEKKRLRDLEIDYLRNVDLLTNAAAHIDKGSFDPEYLVELAVRPDKLGQLARVFQQMAREVLSRQQRLTQQVQELRIQLNEARQKSKVAEITKTGYFRQLKDKAKDLRSIVEGHED
jgi:DNA-binding response OmpR family regulator